MLRGKARRRKVEGRREEEEGRTETYPQFHAVVFNM